MLVDTEPSNYYDSYLDLTKGHYDSIYELLNDINEQFKVICPVPLVTFSCNEITKRITLTLSQLVGNLSISKRLSLVLGFNNTLFASSHNKEHFLETDVITFNATNPFDLQFGSTQIYIYCNVVASQIVGNTYAQLLHTLPVQHNQNSVTVLNPVRSYSVDKLKFNNISILICNEFGEFFDFDHGNIVIGLHFRPKTRYGI